MRFTGLSGKIVIPGNVKTICWEAFGRCLNITEVVLEEGVYKIERNAFYGCENLKEVHVPKSVKIIEPEAFDNAVVYVHWTKEELEKNIRQNKRKFGYGENLEHGFFYITKNLIINEDTGETLADPKEAYDKEYTTIDISDWFNSSNNQP